MKALVLTIALVTLAGCTPAAPGTANPTGGSTTAGGSLTTVSNAEMDRLIACAGTKGQVGAAAVIGWTALKNNVTEAQRAALKTTIEIQAKAIGCL